MEFLEVLTEGLERVLMVRGGGREVITIYSWQTGSHHHKHHHYPNWNHCCSHQKKFFRMFCIIIIIRQDCIWSIKFYPSVLLPGHLVCCWFLITFSEVVSLPRDTVNVMVKVTSQHTHAVLGHTTALCWHITSIMHQRDVPLHLHHSQACAPTALSAIAWLPASCSVDSRFLPSITSSHDRTQGTCPLHLESSSMPDSMQWWRSFTQTTR